MNIHTALLAQIRNPVLPPFLGGGPNPDYKTGGTVIGSLIGAIVGAFIIFSFIFALIFLLVGGISWITAGSDKAQLESARNKITHAIVGLIIVASVWAIMMLVGSFTGINFPTLPFPTIEQGQVPAP
jgi:hypothetical protein